MSAIPFRPWPKTARLNRGCIVTEKIDGTNAAIAIYRIDDVDHARHEDGTIVLTSGDARRAVAQLGTGGDTLVVFAQSRNRFITPEYDNYGFAAWVRDNAQALAHSLGPGTHFGEWWGHGIQRGYGLERGDRRFSLFDVLRWRDALDGTVPGLGTVPLLYEGLFSTSEVQHELNTLATTGSRAVPGYDRPEGVVVYHLAARTGFKALIEGDDIPKGQQQ